MKVRRMIPAAALLLTAACGPKNGGGPTTVEHEATGPAPAPGEDLALVVLVNGAEVFMRLLPGMEGRFADAHDEVAAALDQVGRRLPEAARVALVTYQDGGTTVRAPLGPARDLDAADLGPKDDYQKLAGRIDDGLRAARELLMISAAPRKAVLVIAPGALCDWEEDNLGATVAARKQLDADSIELRGAYYNPEMGGCGEDDDDQLWPSARTDSADQLPGLAADVADQLARNAK